MPSSKNAAGSGVGVTTADTSPLATDLVSKSSQAVFRQRSSLLSPGSSDIGIVPPAFVKGLLKTRNRNEIFVRSRHEGSEHGGVCSPRPVLLLLARGVRLV